MSLIPVRQLLGLGSIPRHRTSAADWLKRNGVKVTKAQGQGGNRDTVALLDLPLDVQRAYLEREVEREGLQLGERDEDAHTQFAELPPKMQAKAERKAQIARFMVAREYLGLTDGELFAKVRAAFGQKDTSDSSLYRIKKTVKGLEVANFAPALVDDYYLDGRPSGPNWDAAWYYALSQISKAGPEWPLDAAFDELEAIKADMGWHVPSRGSFHRRWKGLSEVERFTLRHGEQAAAKRFRQSVLRDREDLAANDCWSLDGRTLDVWAVDDEGTPYRPVELRLVDVASGFVLGSRLCMSENAVDTVALIVGCIRQWGKPKEIYTDNGRAFASHIVAGGATFK